MSLDEDAVKNYRDRSVHEHREALITKAGLSPREAERRAKRTVDEAAERLERRRRGR